MNMNDATQFLVEPMPGFVDSHDRTAAYRLRSAAFQRHLIRDRFEHPLLYRTAGITDLVADVSKLVAGASSFVADVGREAFALWRRHQAVRATSKLWS